MKIMYIGDATTASGVGRYGPGIVAAIVGTPNAQFALGYEGQLLVVLIDLSSWCDGEIFLWSTLTRKELEFGS